MLILKMKRMLPEACGQCSFCEYGTGACLPTEDTDDFFHVFDFDKENWKRRFCKERDPRCPLMEVNDTLNGSFK